MSSPFAVAICTRERPEHVVRALDALAEQDGDFRILVVDQSPSEDPALSRRAAEWPRLSVLQDRGRGLSRARNIAWRRLDAEWIAYVDDDCIVERGWSRALAQEIAANPEVSMISGHLGAYDQPGGDYAPVTTYTVERPQLFAGDRVAPWKIGFGPCTVRRSAIERLGGWDERLGAGCPRFPGGDDMDFNYRLLRTGASAYVTPKVRIQHNQWRRRSDLPRLYEGYMAGWTGFALKQLRTGDMRGGLRLWGYGFLDFARMLASSLRRRSPWRAKLAAYKLRGLVLGTARGLTEPW